jgi:DNA-binding FadR family transcriptional regulator
MTDPALIRARPNRSAKLGTAVIDQLVDDIVRGVLAPGATLSPEADLCEEFGVSRTVIRESVKVIQEKGLLRIQHGRGTQVTDPLEWNLLDETVLTAMIRNDETLAILDELVVVRTTLETEMASAAARLGTPEQLSAAAAELTAMESLLHSTPEFAAADVRFHDAVMVASGNRLGRTIVTRIHDKARDSMRYHGDYTQPAMELTVAEHRRIHQALLAGDEPEAGAAMRAHILGSWARRRPRS